MPTATACTHAHLTASALTTGRVGLHWVAAPVPLRAWQVPPSHLLACEGPGLKILHSDLSVTSGFTLAMQFWGLRLLGEK